METKPSRTRHRYNKALTSSNTGGRSAFARAGLAALEQQRRRRGRRARSRQRGASLARVGRRTRATAARSPGAAHQRLNELITAQWLQEETRREQLAQQAHGSRKLHRPNDQNDHLTRRAPSAKKGYGMISAPHSALASPPQPGSRQVELSKRRSIPARRARRDGRQPAICDRPLS